MPRLFLMRHASAGWAGPGLKDFERPLTEKGRCDATAIGQTMRRRGYLPGLVLCSAAERTRETWSCVAAALGLPRNEGIREITTESIYNGDAASLLDMIRDAPACASLLVVGHNPTIAELAATLPGRGDEAALRAVASGFAKAAFAVLSTEAPLAHLHAGDATLEDLIRPDS